MAKYYACMLIQRVLIPSFLAACSLFRPVALSFLYLLMLFVLPFVPVATPRTIKGRTGIYFKILILISTLTCLSHGIFEIILVSIGFDKIESCGLTERILRHIGFIQLSNLPALSVLIWVSPEIVMFLSSIGFFFLLKSMAIKKVRSPSNTEVTNNGANTESQENNSEHENIIQDSIEFHSVSDDEEPSYTQERMALLTGVAKVIAFATLLLAAAIRPSVPSAVYFLIYLGLGSWWACYRQLGKGFAVILRIVMVFASIHVIAIMLYQTPWPQEFYPANELLPRLLGFTPLFLSSCENSTVVQTNATTFANTTIPDDIRMVTFNSYASIDQVLNPVVILLCFYVTALTSSLLLGPQVQYASLLMRRSTKKLKATVARIRDGSLEEEDTIPLDEMDENEGPDCMEQITVFLENATTFIFKNCYIFMNVAMMTWSIMYHSWLTFVLLIWANILWIIPNQRKTMLRSSPFVVIYAELLLLAQFLYCMGIPDDILPSYVDMKGINLEQIGFVKVWYLPCRPLILKSVFTLMFWITLRQLAQERQQERQTSTLADMVAPLQVTMGAAAADMARADKEQKDERFITKLVAFCTNFLNRFWIWIVVITLFLSGIVGKKMTGFRIIYMTLFLVFLLTFQISRKFWKKIMYGFWLTVIIYAMTILVLVYTYQFDRFPDYWEQYLGISKTLQSDIGLEIYKTRDLFLNLFIPTIVVIMTVLQLHYFHSKFISLIEPPRPNGIAAMMQPPPQMLLPPPPDPNHVLQNMEENLEGLKQKGFFKKFTKISGVSLKQILTFISVAKKKIRTFYELSLIFLELHLIKLVIFMGFWLSIKETCVVHISFVVLTVLAALMRTNKQILMSRIVSVAVGVLLLAKMIYQVTYIQHSDYDVDCQNATESALNNTAEWMGFHKIEKGSNLPGLLRFYIMYITLVTVDVIIRMRQKFVRVIRGESEERPLVMFVKITRKEADNNLRNMLKYLANYGFYKFGVEICLICTVIMIGLRMDIIGLFYAFWLSFMFYVNRGKLSVLWPAFQWFIAISLIVQYIVIVGAPPFLCIKYPWEEGLLKNLQIWAMLPDVSLINIANKLIPEFILLMLVTRQTLVFRIEREFSTSQTEYKGGTNSSVIDDIRGDSNTKFVNPTPDFTSTQRNWLDVLKCGFLLGFFWLALAIVFLTGANRVNLFSVGYLIGSFTFLWQGSDFYLRPIEVITRWWIRLIGYNVFVITSKAVLQIPGCLFYKTLEENCCWLIQLLSIVCAQREKAESAIKDKCVVNANQANIVWDVVCFAFLIIQYRVFQSHYFCHIINDTKASTILASRGAELIEDLKKKQMEQEMEHESKMLKKLKMKMDRIKATQKKFLEPVIDQPKTHAQAIRSGDYYMFEELDDEQELNLFTEKADDDYVEDSTKSKYAKKKKFSEDRGRHIPVIPEEKPSTSKYDGSRKPEKVPDKDHDDDSEEETEEDDSSDSKDNAPERGGIFRILKLIWAFIESFMISIIIRLNKISRHYRYVMRVLAREKIELKKKPDFGSGRRARNMKWIPRVESSETTTEVLQSPSDEQQKGQEKSVSTDEDGEPSTATLSEGDQDQGLAANYAALQQSLMKPRDGDDPERRTSVVPEIRILAPSLERGLDDLPAPSAQPPPPEQQALAPMTSQKVAKGKRKFKVDEIEDFSEKEHSSIVELLMAIWFVILSNTDLVCYFMVFINQINSASLLSLPLPFMVFCWGTLTIPRPSKTFWVTLIAYTQIVVLLKCICQFELLYWNEQPIPPNLPLAPARILGIEKKKSYATYDLALLLILFFHRFMLKSLGLWKSDFKEEPLTQGIYEIKDPSQPSNGQRNEVMEIARLDPDNISGDEDRQLIEVTDIQDEDKKFVPPIMKASLNRHTSSIRRFFSQLLDPSSRVSADVYAYMFFCDFFNFMVVIFGFTAFGSQQGDGGVTAYLEENKVPLAFLIMLILQFALIIIDRALYLRKYMLGKIIFQYGLTLGIHIWMFFVLPAVTERSFNAKNPPVVWYMVKCIYLLLSAYQIRCGYPTRILGNFLTRSFSFLNSMAYKGYMFIPFLFELRTLMDWIWTDTSMTLFDWLKMEDIFANMYQLKCSRNFEEDFPAPRGEKKKSMVKYAMGGGMLFGLIMIIWFPLGLFALGNTVGEANPPYEVSVSMKIGPYEPIYMANAQGANIRKFGEAEWQQLNTPYKRDKTAVTFLSNYEADDVAVIDLGPNSTSIWSISPPDRERLREDLEQNITLKMVFRYTVSRLTYSKENPGVISEQTTFDLEPGDPKREVLSRMLNGSSDSIDIPHLLPKFMKVKNSGSLKPIPQLIPMEYGEMAGDRNITLRLYESLGDRWWELKENCSDEFYIDVLSRIPSSDCKSAIVFYTFNDKLFPPTLSYLTGGGIIGMYTTFIFVISRVIRGIFAGSSFKIMYDDLPYVDRILQLCLDIYLVRESMEFAIEEDLFAKLIFLYRSPETMIKWTRPKEEDATHPSISVTATGGPRRNEDDDENNDDTSIRSSSPPQLRKRQI